MQTDQDKAREQKNEELDAKYREEGLENLQVHLENAEDGSKKLNVPGRIVARPDADGNFCIWMKKYNNDSSEDEMEQEGKSTFVAVGRQELPEEEHNLLKWERHRSERDEWRQTTAGTKEVSWSGSVNWAGEPRRPEHVNLAVAIAGPKAGFVGKVCESNPKNGSTTKLEAKVAHFQFEKGETHELKNCDLEWYADFIVRKGYGKTRIEREYEKSVMNERYRLRDIVKSRNRYSKRQEHIQLLETAVNACVAYGNALAKIEDAGDNFDDNMAVAMWEINSYVSTSIRKEVGEQEGLYGARIIGGDKSKD